MPRDIVVVGAGFKGRVAVEEHVSGVPAVLREIDPDLKVFYNMDSLEYEVWGLDARGPYMLGSWRNLDNRVVEAVRRGYHLARNARSPWRAHLAEVRARNKRLLDAVEKETADLDYGLRDDFRWFGTSLWPGWRGGR